MQDDSQERIESILIEKKRVSGGHNGTYAPSLCQMLGLEYKIVRTPLNKLYKEKKIDIREGSQGKLIFWKN